MSSHRLEIEAGRWAIEDRKCRTCNLIEDEYHFVIECSLFKEIRGKFNHKYYWKRPSMFKFVDLINSSNQKKTIRNLSFFIFKHSSVAQNFCIVDKSYHINFNTNIYLIFTDVQVCIRECSLELPQVAVLSSIYDVFPHTLLSQLHLDNTCHVLMDAS